MSTSTTSTSPPPLVGLFDIQKSYLDSLSANVPVNLETPNMVANLEAQLNTMHTNYNKASQNVNDVLTKQTEMQSIVDREKTRLLEKKSIVDDTYNGKLRGSQLNESYRQKRSAYMKILITICVVLIVYLIIYFVFKTFGLPDSIGNMISIIMFSVAILYIISVITDIYKRDNMDYSTLNLPPPKNAVPLNVVATQSAAASSGNLLGSIANPKQCSGLACCDTSVSVWNPKVNQCISKSSSTCTPDKYYNLASNACILKDNCTTSGGSVCGNICIPAGQTCYENIETFSNLGSILPFNFEDQPKFSFV